MAKRGQLTDAIRHKMETFLGRPTSLGELHLIPYLQYVMVNDQVIDPKKINREERDILSLLRKAGHIEGGASGLAVTREYFAFMCDVLFDAYVAFEEADPTAAKGGEHG